MGKGEFMTKNEILVKAIKKAVKNGWKEGEYWLKRPYEESGLQAENSIARYKRRPEVLYRIIFSHDFAKAFWGEGVIEDKWRTAELETSWYAWEFHITEMVLEPDPVKYLEKYI